MCIFNCFYFLSFFGFAFEFVTVFVFVGIFEKKNFNLLKNNFPFFQVGVEGVGGANPFPKLVSSLGKG